MVNFYSKLSLKMAKMFLLANFDLFELVEVYTSTSPNGLTNIKETISSKKKISKLGYDCAK